MTPLPANQPLLIVEDEEDDVFFLKRAIQKTGITNAVFAVATGQAAIDYLKGSGEFADRRRYPFPFLIFLDLKLPCVGGIDVLKWIRSDPASRSVIVVVLSSSTLAEDINEAYASGANSYFVKPADPAQLLEYIRDFANWWLRRNVPPPANMASRPGATAGFRP